MTLINETVAPHPDLLDRTTACPAPLAKILRHARPTIADNGSVRLGAQTPVFRRSAAIADSGKVRIGAQRMIF